MPSTDIDGSKIVILSAAEGRRVYAGREIAGGRGLDTVEHSLAEKIARDLKLPSLE